MFCNTLKESTSELHEQAETRPFIHDLMSGSLNARAYARYLQALQPVYATLENHMRTAPDPVIAVFDHRLLDRTERMDADLANFGLPTDSQATKATRSYCDAIADSSVTGHRLLAHHYTRYLGDMAGGQAISRLMQRHYGIGPESLTFYDFTSLGDARHYRKQYKQLMDYLPWTPTQQAEFIAESQVAYQLNIDLFNELGEVCGSTVRQEPTRNAFFSSEKHHQVNGGR